MQCTASTNVPIVTADSFASRCKLPVAVLSRRIASNMGISRLSGTDLILGRLALTLRLTFLPPASSRLVDQELFELLPTFDRGDKPPRSRSATCPCFPGRTTIFRGDLPPFQCASSLLSGGGTFACQRV